MGYGPCGYVGKIPTCTATIFALLLCGLSDLSTATAQTTNTLYGDHKVEFDDSSTGDRALKAELDSWYKEQSKQDCENVKGAGPSVDIVKRAFAGDKKVSVFGPKDPYNRRATVQSLRWKNNPRGEGDIVIGWNDSNPRDSADYVRERFIWLVLDKKLYPLNVSASGSMGKLFDGLPQSIQKRAQLVHTYEKGKTILDQLGIEDKSFKRFPMGTGGTPFPNCQPAG